MIASTIRWLAHYGGVPQVQLHAFGVGHAGGESFTPGVRDLSIGAVTVLDTKGMPTLKESFISSYFKPLVEGRIKSGCITDWTASDTVPVAPSTLSILSTPWGVSTWISALDSPTWMWMMASLLLFYWFSPAARSIVRNFVPVLAAFWVLCMVPQMASLVLSTDTAPNDSSVAGRILSNYDCVSFPRVSRL